MSEEHSGFGAFSAIHYVAPGATMLLAFVGLVVATEYHKMNVDLADFGIPFLILFLLAAYVLGQLLSLAGTQLDKFRRKFSGGFPAETLLSERDAILSPVLRKNLKKMLSRDFLLPLGGEADLRMNANDAFNLAYSWLQAKGMAMQSRRNELEFLLLRNLTVAGIGVLVLGITVLIQLLNDPAQAKFPDGSLNWTILGVGVFYFTLSGYFVIFSMPKLQGLSTRFCASVYETYFAARRLAKATNSSREK